MLAIGEKKRKMKVAFSLCFLAHAAALSSMEELDYPAWLEVWRKTYTGSEYDMRQAIFEENKQKVQAHNAEYRAGKHTWWMALNELADWTPEEFATLRSHKYAPSTAPIATYRNTTGNPASLDWYIKCDRVD